MKAFLDFFRSRLLKVLRFLHLDHLINPHPWLKPHYVSWLNSRSISLSFIISSLLYFLLVSLATIPIYHQQRQTGWSNLAEQIFPYPAALVDDQIIYLSRFRRETNALIFYAQKHNLASTPDKEVGEHVINQLINQVLYTEALQQAGISINPTDVQKALNDIYKSKGGQAQLATFLENNYGSNMSLLDFRLLTQDSLVESAVEHQILEHAEVRHILISLPDNPTDAQVADALKKAQDTRARITDPSQFAEIAKDVSDDAASRDNGGDLGVTVRSPDLSQRFSTDFENAIFTLPVGQISQPIRSHYGWHLILVESRSGKVDKDIDEYTSLLRSKAKIRNYIKN